MELKPTNWKIWLIRSTFGIHKFEVDRLPKNSCQLIWKFLISVLSIPFAWSSHVVNLIRRKTEMNAGWGFVIQIIGMSLTAGIMNPNGNSFSKFQMIAHLQANVKVMPIDERLLYIYLLGPFAVFAFIICIGVGLLCCAPFIIGFDFLKGKWDDRDSSQEWFSDPNSTMYWVAEGFRGIKNKFCVKI